jgi:hypothetical protein
MAQAGYTPIQLYYSLTAASAPIAGNLASGELAINATDGKLFYKDNANVVQVIGWKTTPATAGGTGQTSYAVGDLLYASSTTALSRLAVGANGSVLTLTAGVPTWSASAGGVTSFQTSLSGLTPSTATTGVVTLAGTLGATSGGTSFSTYATGDIIYASASNTLSKLTAGTNGFVLTLAAGVPTWAASTGGVTSFSAGTTGLTPNTATTGAIVLAGTLTTANGGTGLSSFTAGDLVYFASGTSFTKLGIGTAGQVLTVNPGATAPQWSTGAASGVASISFGTTGLTPNTATTGAVVVAGTLIAVNGGTGISSYAQGEMLYANTTTTLDKVTANITTSKKYLSQTGNGTAGLAPTWGDVTATNIAGGTAGTLFYNTAADSTTTLSIGTAYQLLGVNAGATAPSWQGLSSLIDNGLTAATQGQILYRNATAWVPLAVGTSGQVLTSGGAAANVSWTTAAGGLTGFTAALNTGGTNTTVNVSSLVASGGTTNQHAAIVPKGTASFMLAIPDSGTAGGATRGTYSVDLQLSRSSVAAVAGGDYGGILAGNNNTITSGTASAIIAGGNNVLLGAYSTILGGDANTLNNSAGTAVISSFIIGGVGNFISRSYGTIINGRYGTSRAIFGALVVPSAYNYAGSTLGAQQSVQIQMGIETTNATATRITTDGNAADTRNIPTLNNNGAMYFKGRVIANVTGAGNSKVWTFEGGLKRGATAATTVLIGSVATNIVAADAGASTWTIAVTADTTNGGLNVTVTGQAATTIRWNCQIDTVEMSF